MAMDSGFLIRTLPMSVMDNSRSDTIALEPIKGVPFQFICERDVSVGKAFFSIILDKLLESQLLISVCYGCRVLEVTNDFQ